MSVQELKAMPWSLWGRQTASIVRLELKRNFFSKRGWWIYLLALGPVFITGMHSLIETTWIRHNHGIGEDSIIYAGIFLLFYLRLGIFFGCAGIFSNLFRGEVLEKTLHYYFLAPVRREVLVAAKYLVGVVIAVVFFAGSAALSFLLISMHYGQTQREFLFQGPGLGQLQWYMIITVLACIGYGAVFLATGLMFRNPMIPAAVVMVWEAVNEFLPPLLKKFSVIFYLKSLTPVDVPLEGPFVLIAVSADPVPVWMAIPGLLAVSLAVLAYAAWKARKLEVSYSE